MKRACLMPMLLGLLLPAGAQNLMETLNGGQPFDAAAAEGLALRAQAELPESAPAIATQHPQTLASGAAPRQDGGMPAELTLLGAPTPYQLISSRQRGSVAAVPEAMKPELDLISATYRELGRVESDCRQLALSLQQQIKADATRLLEVLAVEIRANPGCACEIVKAAITAADASVEEVLAIVETAITTAPETMRIVSQCAIAAMPESLPAIQTLLAKYDANAGESGISAKSAKSGKEPVVAAANDVAAIPNPLDFPGFGPVGPIPGGPGGQPLIPPFPPILITPPRVTEVDP